MSETQTYNSKYYQNTVKTDEERINFVKLCSRTNKLYQYTNKRFPELKNDLDLIKNDNSISIYEKMKRIKLLSVEYELDKYYKENETICKWIKRGVNV